MLNLKVLEPELNMENELSRLALEANFVNNLIAQFTQIIPGLAIKLVDNSQIFKNNLFEKPQIKELKQGYEEAKKISDAVNFANYKDTLVSVPEGFKGNFSDYLKVLIKLSPLVYKEANEFLTAYNAVLSDFITNKDSKMCNTAHDSLFNKIDSTRLSYIKEIEHFFSAKSDSSKIRLSDMIGRFSDMRELLDLSIKLEQLQALGNIQQIADAVDKSVFLLNVIKKNLEEDQITEVCGVTANSISQGTYQLAQFVEFIAIFRFKCNQASTAVKNTFEKIKDFK